MFLLLSPPLLSFPASLPLPPSLSLSLSDWVWFARGKLVSMISVVTALAQSTPLNLKRSFASGRRWSKRGTLELQSGAARRLFLIYLFAFKRMRAVTCVVFTLNSVTLVGCSAQQSRRQGFVLSFFSFFCFLFSLLPVGCLKEPRPLRDVRECEEQFCAPVKFPEVSEVCMWWLMKGENEGAGPAQGLMVCLG